MNSSKKIVVLTPVKNEAWILPLFLQSASIWCDYILIADQNSTDGSKEIASKFPKVVLIENNSDDLDEDKRNHLIVEKARELVGTDGIFFRLDADEFLTPNFDSTELDAIRQSEKGTMWRFRWIMINKGLSSCWEMPKWTVFGAFVDDGSTYSPHGLMHNRELFPPKKKCYAKELCVLHFQFVDWNRMRCKHIWYQCFERINFPQKSAIDIYRIYHWMYNPNIQYKSIPKEWFEVYKEKYNIDLSDYKVENHYWWDDKVNEYFAKYTPRYFRRIETCRQKELFHAEGKSLLDKILLLYLRQTTRTYNRKRGFLYHIVKKTDAVLKRLCKL